MTCTLIGFLLFFQHVSLEKHPENLLQWSKPSQVSRNILWSRHLIFVCPIYYCDIYMDNWESQVWNTYTQSSPWWRNLHVNKDRGKKERERDVTLSILQVSNWAQYSSLIFFFLWFTLGMNSLVEWQKEEEEMKWEDGYRRGLNKTKTNRQIVQSGTFSCGHGFLQGLLQHRSHHVISSYHSNMGLSYIKG